MNRRLFCRVFAFDGIRFVDLRFGVTFGSPQTEFRLDAAAVVGAAVFAAAAAAVVGAVIHRMAIYSFVYLVVHPFIFSFIFSAVC